MVIIAEKINETTKKSIERKAFLEVTTNIELKIKKLHTKYKKTISDRGRIRTY